MSASLEKVFEKLDELSPSEQLEAIAYLAQKLKRQSKGQRQSPEQLTLIAEEQTEQSALDRAQQWVGCIDDGSEDVSTNPRYLEGYGG